MQDSPSPALTISLTSWLWLCSALTILPRICPVNTSDFCSPTMSLASALPISLSLWLPGVLQRLVHCVSFLCHHSCGFLSVRDACFVVAVVIMGASGSDLLPDNLYLTVFPLLPNISAHWSAIKLIISCACGVFVLIGSYSTTSTHYISVHINFENSSSLFSKVQHAKALPWQDV